MTETLGTELTRTSTQFFDINPEVDTNINSNPLTQQETEYFDAAETVSGNSDETTGETNTATPTTTSTVTQSFDIDTLSHVFRFQPNQPDSKMTGDGGRENDGAERPASAGDNDTVSHSFRFQQPNPNLEKPDSEMTEDGDNNMGDDGGEDTPRAGTPYPDMDDMDPWAENMDQADGGESDIHEEFEVRKRLRTSPFPFEDDEELRAQSSRRFNVGFQ
jgi:hypothetical protein